MRGFDLAKPIKFITDDTKNALVSFGLLAA